MTWSSSNILHLTSITAATAMEGRNRTSPESQMQATEMIEIAGHRVIVTITDARARIRAAIMTREMTIGMMNAPPTTTTAMKMIGASHVTGAAKLRRGVAKVSDL
mmetsp:Transcript_81081/g.217820  ORF Transcript_81081/g.217820 Transcript_81081/m.217820 type:complete len:105 (-) Transcript_81081:1055-1369(-)